MAVRMLIMKIEKIEALIRAAIKTKGADAK